MTTSKNLHSADGIREASTIGKSTDPKRSLSQVHGFSKKIALSLLTTLGLVGAPHILDAQAIESTGHQDESVHSEILTQLYQALQQEKELYPELSTTFLSLIDTLRKDKETKPYTDEFIKELDTALHIQKLPAHMAFLQKELYNKLIIERDYELEESANAPEYRVYVVTTDAPLTLVVKVNNREVVINSKTYAEIAGDLGDSLTESIEFTSARPNT